MEAVILTRPEAYEVAPLAKVWSQYRKVPLVDGATHARQCWGILAEDLQEPAAEDLLSHLRQAQLSGTRLPAERLITPAPPQPLRHMSDLPAGELSVIGAALFQETTTKKTQVTTGPTTGQRLFNAGVLLSTGIPLSLGGKKRVETKSESHSELLCFLDLCPAGGAQRWRIDGQTFDYSFLKERKTYSVLSNFKLLVADLAQRAPQALQNRGTRLLLSGGEMRQMGYASLQDLDRELRWLLTLASLPKE